MSLWRLVKRSLGFYWRMNLGILLAALVGTAVLVGALAVGDSVRYSLKMLVKARLGETQFALVTRDRFFRDKLADELSAELNTPAAPLLQLRGLIANSNGTRRANRIEVLGVDERFYKLAAEKNPLVGNWSEGVVLNEALAAKLGAGVGDEVVLRIEKPALMPRDIPLSPDSDLSVAFRLQVRAVAGTAEFGRFSLQSNQVSPLNVFVPMQWLQGKLGHTGQANMLLVASNPQDNITVEKVNAAVKKCWQPGDAGIELRRLDRQDALQIRSNRVFIDDSLAEAAMKADSNAVGILTYFVNELRLGDKATPYSMVAAIGLGGSFVPMDMQDNEILINQWLADDLGARVGDSLELTYFVLGPTRKLQQQSSRFRVRQILPMENPAVDPELMPDFPGLSDVKNCRDWKPGIPIDLDKIHPRDEDYWQRYRGSPKAFITLKAGQRIWDNRYGSLTAVRYPHGKGAEEDIAGRLLNATDPASLGLFFQSVRQRGIKAGDEATDFGQLFLSFSVFLIIAAMVLMGLVFVFGVESRMQQIGMLLAVGFSPKLVRRLLFMEGGTLAVLGAIAGTAAGLLYTRIMIYGLATGWQVAVGGVTIHFYVRASTLLIGALTAVAVSLIAIWLTLRRQVSRPARELLAGIPLLDGINRISFNRVLSCKSCPKKSRGRIGLWIAAAAAVGAVVLLVTMGTGDSGTVSAAFFGAGALLLVAGLGLSQALLKIAAGSWNKPVVSLVGLGLRNSTRRSGRSLAVVAMLACGIFLVVAVGANRPDTSTQAHRRPGRSPGQDQTRLRRAGTGGFALFGESTIPVLHDLNSQSGRRAMGLDDTILEGVEIVQLRVRDGDDASCLNLNRAQMPRLLGVQPEHLQMRGSFRFIKTIEDTPKADAWKLLKGDYGRDIVPAIGDYATIVWALGKSIGDQIDYIDERGQKFHLLLAGMLKSSILQGSLLISEDQFIKRFPSENGYRMFLVDAAEDKTEAVAEKLSAALRDFGLAFTPTEQRLAEFTAVENTYLSIFQLIGGLGLILGSAGLGLVVLRNILERRGELAMLRAVGFYKGAVKRMVFYEHWLLLLGGLACGVIAALVATGPAIKSPRAEVPYFSLAMTIVAIAVSGAVWIWMAGVFALRGEMLEALRNE
jgi:putative ABC transport system permease protein